jgi:hypothetical protein
VIFFLRRAFDFLDIGCVCYRRFMPIVRKRVKQEGMGKNRRVEKVNNIRK